MRLLRLLAVLLAVAVVVPAAAGAASRAEVRKKVIGAGASVAGIPVGGMQVRDAERLLAEQLAPRVLRPVQVRVGRRTFTLTPERAKLRFDAFLTARRAYRAARDAEAPTGPRVEGGAVAGVEVEPKVTHSRLAVRAWTREVRDAITRAPRDATLRMTVKRMRIRSARRGRTIDPTKLQPRVRAQLADPLGERAVIRVRKIKTRPAVDNQELRRRYHTVITVDRRTFTLRLFKRLRLAKRYKIALGAAGYETPSGRYTIQNKAVNPAWHVPNSPWAGSLAGTVVPGGAPNNPLKARWLGIVNGVGIHGTAEEWSIGSRASHGCIRMRVADVIDLYPRVPVGTPVLIN